MASESQNSSTTKVLSWGKIEKYDSPLFPNSWRIGTIADGSCFFHAILTAIDKTYRDIKGDGIRGIAQSEKQQRVEMIRGKIGKKLTMKNWQTLQGGEPAHLALTEQIRHTESIVSRVISNPDKYQKSKSRKWIYDSLKADQMHLINTVLGSDLLDMSNFTSACKVETGYCDISASRDTFVAQETKNFVRKVSLNVKPLVKKFGQELIEQTVISYRSFLKTLFDMSAKLALQCLVDHFKDPSQWIGTEYLVYLSDQFDVNIVIIDAGTGFPYITAEKSYLKDSRQTIYLLALNESHYECIATQIQGGGKRARITCKYETDGEQTQKVFSLLDKETAFSTHPQLAAAMYGEEVIDEDSSEDDDERLVYSDSDSD